MQTSIKAKFDQVEGGCGVFQLCQVVDVNLYPSRRYDVSRANTQEDPSSRHLNLHQGAETIAEALVRGLVPDMMQSADREASTQFDRLERPGQGLVEGRKNNTCDYLSSL